MGARGGEGREARGEEGSEGREGRGGEGREWSGGGESMKPTGTVLVIAPCTRQASCYGAPYL